MSLSLEGQILQDQEQNELGFILVTAIGKEYRFGHCSFVLTDKPVSNGFLEKVHSIPICFWFKA